MKKIILLLLILLTSVAGAMQVSSQGTPYSFSLQQSIEFALKSKASLKATRNEERIAKAKVGEIRAIGLPQVNASAEVGNNFIQQKTALDPSGFGPQMELQPFVISQGDIASGQDIRLTPTYAAAEQRPNQPLQIISFVQPYTGSLTVSGSQLLFDGSYLIGLKAASTYTELSRKSTIQSEIEIADQVSKAYYSVLVNRSRMELLNQNLVRLDTLLKQTDIMYKNGVAEKLDVDRLRVSFNNLNVEKQRTERLLDLSLSLLKFQMGMLQQEELELTDQLEEVEVELNKISRDDFNYGGRIEYSILETQRQLAHLDLRNIRSGYLPKLNLNARYGYAGFGQTFSDVMNIRAGHNNVTNRNWFDFGYVGVQLQVPIFDGLRKSYQIQQAKITLDNTELGFEELRQSIDLQLTQASTEIINSIDVLKSRKENMELAEEIARVAKIKFQEGVGSNLEVVTAETDLREAQTNYYAAMYDALIAKVNLDKATGTLLAK
ncbi:TolC family protein [Pontibacter beigongshangensis]|uniref:TolC family protein n=1 Tax=Pontibacter beigongshangensis TaxID=2574733 RepID=UPI0016505CFD|nr:TolC family protein [Pontibacter beigongshangensis]